MDDCGVAGKKSRSPLMEAPAPVAAGTLRESEEAPPCETPRRLATLIRAAILVSAMYRGRRGREKHGVVDYDPYDGFSTSKMRPPPPPSAAPPLPPPVPISALEGGGSEEEGGTVL